MKQWKKLYTFATKLGGKKPLYQEVPLEPTLWGQLAGTFNIGPMLQHGKKTQEDYLYSCVDPEPGCI